MADSDITADGPEPRRPERSSRPRYDDDRHERRRRRPDEDDAVSSLIPFNNPTALIAYYCGVFGLIPCVGGILAPVALIMGIIGLRTARQHPSAKGTGHAIAGIVLGGLSTLGHLAFAGILVLTGLR